MNLRVETEIDFKTLFHYAHEPIFLFPVAPGQGPGTFVDVNDEACRLLGYTREELRQFTPLDLSYPEASEHFPELVGVILATHRLSFDGAYRHKNGEYIPLEYRCSLISTAEGFCVLTHARDLRQRLQLLRDLTRVNTENRMVFDLCPDMIGIITGDRVTDINRAGVQLLRAKDRDAVIGRSFWDFLHPDFHALVTTRLSAAASTGVSNAPVEQAYIRDDGTVVKVEVKSTLLPTGACDLPQYLFLTRDITLETAQRDHLLHLAYRDFLTGLWNRRKLLDKLSEVMAVPDTHTALLLMDIDNFKQVNDTHGHDLGDLLLVEVATRLRNLESESVFVARTGGDEFCVVFTAYTSRSDVEHLADQVVRAFQFPFFLDGHTLTCSTSVGAAHCSDSLRSTRDLLKAADIALYQAKERGRNQTATYNPAP